MRIRRIASVALAGALFWSGPALVSTAASAAVASDAEALTPPPPPVTSDGVQLQGSWSGPYTVRNLNSERCLDINGASTANGALAVQYRCVAGGVSQMWWSWFVEGDGFIAYQLHANAHSGKCIRPVSTARGVAVVQQPCAITPAEAASR